MILFDVLQRIQWFSSWWFDSEIDRRVGFPSVLVRWNCHFLALYHAASWSNSLVTFSLTLTIVWLAFREEDALLKTICRTPLTNWNIWLILNSSWPISLIVLMGVLQSISTTYFKCYHMRKRSLCSWATFLEIFRVWTPGRKPLALSIFTFFQPMRVHVWVSLARYHLPFATCSSFTRCDFIPQVSPVFLSIASEPSLNCASLTCKMPLASICTLIRWQHSSPLL